MSFRPLPAKSPAALLRETKPLQSLLSEVQRLSHLQLLLESQLQPAARTHCRIAAWREGKLLLIVDDSHWATRLRYQERRLLRLLRAMEAFAGLQRILLKVQPAQSAAGMVNRPRLSAAAAESIQAAAVGISYPPLRTALERLARHITSTP